MLTSPEEKYDSGHCRPETVRAQEWPEHGGGAKSMNLGFYFDLPYVFH